MKTELAQAPTEGAALPLPMAGQRALAAKGWRRRLRQGVRLFGFVAALLACLSILGLLLTAALPGLWGYSSFVIYTGSMEPTISVGSLVVAQPVDAQEVTVSDIIIFPAPGNPNTTITHRVVAVREDDGGLRYFQTKGDAVDGVDPQEVQLTGRVYRFAYELPYLGYFVHFAKSGPGIMMLLILPAAGLLLLQFQKIRRPGAPEAEAAEASPEG